MHEVGATPPAAPSGPWGLRPKRSLGPSGLWGRGQQHARGRAASSPPTLACEGCLLAWAAVGLPAGRRPAAVGSP